MCTDDPWEGAPLRWRVYESGVERTAVAVIATDGRAAGPPSRRELLALAAVLAATALTGAAAIAGLTRKAPATPTTPQIGQIITPATPTPPRRIEPGD